MSTLHRPGPPRTVRVAIIGAGFGGLGVAMRLRAAGFHDITVFEREPDVGGTWLVNTYPGAACDAPSHLYSYSFAQDVEWSRRFATAAEIQRYLHRCVRGSGISDMIRTGTEVRSAHWDGAEWVIGLADGRRSRADVLVPAVGQLSVPAVPPIPGLESFTGPAFHTARWRHDVDLSGKRVAVVGTGASAIQVVPAIAPAAGHVVVLQRTAPYVFTKGDVVYTPRTHRRNGRLPWLKRAQRLAIWSYFEAVTLAFTRTPAALTVLRRLHERVLRREVADPVLRDRLRPRSRAGCKRILISDDYYATLCRPNVSVETGPIEAITPTGIRAGGRDIPVDAIVFGTGFATSSFVSGVEIVGSHGTSLAQAWSRRAGAFLGLSVPGFPNMFLVYGPNTNLGSGSIVYMLESQAAHIVAAARMLAAGGAHSLEVTERAYRGFQAALTRRQPHTVWQGCRSWYLDERGHDTHNWPWLMSTYRRRTRRLRRSDYRITTAADRESVG